MIDIAYDLPVIRLMLSWGTSVYVPCWHMHRKQSLSRVLA